MDKKKVKEWINDALEKGYDREDIEELLDSYVKNDQITNENKIKILEEFEDKISEKERLNMKFKDRWKLKKTLKILKKLNKESGKRINILLDETKKLNKKEKTELKNLKQQIIDAIMGKDEKEGLYSIFNITDWETNEPITREKLETYEINELQEIFEELLEDFAKEI